MAECAVPSPLTSGSFCVLDAGHGGKHRDHDGGRYAKRPDDAEQSLGVAAGMAAEALKQARLEQQAAAERALIEGGHWRSTAPEDAGPDFAELDAAERAAAAMADLVTGEVVSDTPDMPGTSGDTGDTRPTSADTPGDTGAAAGPGVAEEPEPDHAGAGAGAGADRPPAASGANNYGRQANVEREATDWTAIKRRYVEGVNRNDADRTIDWPSLDKVAEHFGLGAQRVRERSAAEGWVEQRSRFQAQVERVRQQAKANALAQRAVRLDDRALQASELGIELCLSALGDIGRRAQAARAETVGSGTPSGGIDAQEQQRLAYAVDLWHRIGLRALGDPEVTRLEISGPNGRPVEIAQELRRDDPNRIVGVLSVLQAAGLGDLFGRAEEPAAHHRGGDGGRPALPPGS